MPRILPGVAFLLLSFSASGAEGLRARSAAGEFLGREKNGARLFANIAYAAAPVGALRWRRAPLLETARQANAPVRCPQEGTDHFGATPLPQSEDCLYLNVWAPLDPPREPRPVLFWIHGGGLLAGSGIEDFYDGSIFAKKGIVFVGINYRLGELGYGPKLDPRPGSLGLLDQATALRWVEKNIAAFGGDPKRIFLMGHSKGAEAVTALMQSGLAGESVRGGITMSYGAVFDRWWNGSVPPAQVKFLAGERDAPTERVIGSKKILVYVPELPALRAADSPGPRYTLLNTVVFNERFWRKDSEFYCIQGRYLAELPPYLDGHFLLLHAGGAEHGQEVYDLFRQRPFGRALLDYFVRFLEEGKPPRRTFFRPARFREAKQLTHFYRWFSLPGSFSEALKDTDCLYPKGYENGRTGPFWMLLERALRVFGHGREPDFWETTMNIHLPPAP